MSSLAALRIPPEQGDLPTAAQHNGVLDHLLRNRILSAADNVSPAGGMRHPWKVQVARFEDRPGSTLQAEETWRVDVACGVIQDTLPTIPYLRQKDPRGWSLPQDYVEPNATTAATPVSPWIDRDVCDDLDDPPFLILRELADFTQISDEARLAIEGGAFCSEADWERELYRAHVLLSSIPLAINTAIGLPAPSRRRLRLYTSRRVPAAVIAEAGVVFELATVYLLRDPADPAGSEIRVRQREFFSLWTELVQPSGDLPALIANLGQTGDGLTDLIATLSAGSVETALSGTATLEAWSV